MLKRLLSGLVKGALIGSLLAVVLVKGLGMLSFPGALVAYPVVMLLGATTGLVAGKPIWAKGAKIEAGVKAVVGAGIASVELLLLRKWLNVDLDLSLIGAGAGAIGTLPAASLPLVAAALALVFEADNTDEQPVHGGKRQRVASVEGDAGAAEHAEVEAEAEADESRAAEHRGRRA